MNAVLIWFRENWGLICICFGILINAAGLAYNVTRYIRAGGLRRAEGWQELLAAARKYECEAESIAGMDGAAKLEYVLAKLEEYTALLGFEYDREMLEGVVQKDIAFANEMKDIKSERPE